SNIAAATVSSDYILQDWKAAGLSKPSAFRTYVGTEGQGDLQVIGHLSDRDWQGRDRGGSQCDGIEHIMLRHAMPESSDKPNSTQKLPPPSFSLLVATFASQAMVAFGKVPDPIEGKTEVRLELARHAIDMLDILEQKTKGNLTADEAAMLEGILHQLRLDFVEAMTIK